MSLKCDETLYVKLKDRAVVGAFWNALDAFSSQGITFVIGLVLARLLSPDEFGVIGLTVIFVAVAQVFTDGGLSQALIRHKNCTDIHFNTIFIFNIICGLSVYFGIFLLAPNFCSFFDNKITPDILRTVSLVIVINSLSIIQQTILTRNIDFKLQTKISLISSITSGTIAIGMACRGCGVWSLVGKILVDQTIRCSLLWVCSSWKPRIKFDKKAFSEMFSFGSKLLMSSLLNTIFDNLYYVVIGKFFSASSLGFYTRAEQFARVPSVSLTGVVQKVSYPVLAKLQDDEEKLVSSFRKILISTMFISFILMFGLGAISKPLIITMLGEKWSDSIIYLRLLCASMALYPLHALNLNVLNIKGRSDLFLRLEVIKKLMTLGVILIGIKYGIVAILQGSIILSIVSYFLNAHYTSKLISFSITSQIMSILPSFLVAFVMSLILITIEYISDLSNFVLLPVLIIVGAIISLALSEAFNIDAYLFIKNSVLSYTKIKPSTTVGGEEKPAGVL